MCTEPRHQCQVIGLHSYVGRSTTETANRAKVLLEEYVSEEDDEIDDAGLFRETRTSRLIYQTLSDYSELYPYAKDGISIGAYCGEIQPLDCWVDEFIS